MMKGSNRVARGHRYSGVGLNVVRSGVSERLADSTVGIVRLYESKMHGPNTRPRKVSMGEGS